ETHTTVALRAGQTTDVGAVRLPRSAAIRGFVRDADGNRIARAMVQLARGGLADNPALALLQPAAASTRTGDPGEFALTGLPPGRPPLLASAAGFASGRRARRPDAARAGRPGRA